MNKSLRQKQKFEHLYKKPEQHDQALQTVHNFSNTNISQDAINILQKGFNFAITPKRIPVENIITNVEIALTTVEQPIADEIRLDIANILKKARPPAQNVTKKELNALKELKNNNDVLILPADKGNATVIVNNNDYHQKMITLLNSSEYKTSNTDPTTYLEKKTISLIKSTSLSDKVKQELIPREKSSRIPKIYGLPKIHKENWPLRPIVSAFNSPTHKLARYLAKELQPICVSASSYIKNSLDFLTFQWSR
ncbi:hypothetical protein RI129_011053 [Pyrocoelia pectoralis]|uniref:Reverse transcriptase n=1 Tax=Pyrocoelia pectoralis TaxID=417401 RepID=A0AAN7V3A1_9COLE